MDAAEVISAWDIAPPGVIHPSRAVSEEAYWRSGEEHAAIIAALLDPGAQVLDFGCGDGRVAIPLRRLGFDVIAADSSPTMLTRLTARAPDVRTLRTDGTGLARALGHRVDAVVCLAVLIHHSHTDGAALITELASVLSPGGLLVVHWPTSGTPYERRTWIEVSTWSPESQHKLTTGLGLTPVPAALPWLTFRLI